MASSQTQTHRYFIALLLLSAAFPPSSSSDDAKFAKSLIQFKQSLTNAAALDGWLEPAGASARLCSRNTPLWSGCICLNGSFVGLRLVGMGLGGAIDAEALAELPLYTFSVARNNFTGPMPDLGRLTRLRSLYLSDNGFRGEIRGDAFAGMRSVRKVVLAGNYFSGDIPASLVELPRLVDLRLQDNMFGGRLLEFRQANLTGNFSNNRLRGSIPAALSGLNATSFYGNPDLCGTPLAPCKTRKHFPKIPVIAAALAGAALSAFITLTVVHRRRPKHLKYSKSMDGFPMEDPKPPNKKKKQDQRLCFVNHNIERFELDDLLRASAQVLGSGSFGSSYKAALPGRHSYVVRRFRRMNNLSREDFSSHMARLGRLSHPNLVPLVAFHYTRDEKLLITKFIENGSLASHLHGNRGSGRPGLDWATCLRIIKGVARGLAYLYRELPTLCLPHGHLKSSNVLLHTNYQPLVADYASAPVMDKGHAEQLMAAYKSPESTESEGVTRKTDVWSLGILILEVLTGQFRASYLKQGRWPSSDLATWVGSVVGEEWAAEVLDRDMGGSAVGLLKIGKHCCEWDVERRWDMREAVERIQELEE
ncbi:probable LRR receptor-like serine/threonine-protein kinase At4g31250 [Salvia splendens]|nr:probable LRR receptor-like serine/threonine-protein kinase At4g31250 [Salvia splendens]